MMNSLRRKLTDKEFVQSILAELLGDVLMIGIGLLGGYLIKVSFM
jgi:hypothetical protein